MTSDLIGWITVKLDSDTALSAECQYVVLAALESDDDLAAVLSTAQPSSRPRPPPSLSASSEPPIGAFLSAVAVEGFRGIGHQARLTLPPRPGLVVVAGRNGSGKSSFAEAMELALTGTSYRWKGKSATWTSSWRNLHAPSPTGIRVELAEEGQGKTTVAVEWDDNSGLDDRRVWVQRHGEPRVAGLGTLGWAERIETFRPFLSYDELGGLLEAGPSQLYDALSKVLGLEQVTDGLRRLEERLKKLNEPGKRLREDRIQLKNLLADLRDGRAEAAARQLGKHSQDLDMLEGLSTGTTHLPASEIGRLRSAAAVTVPSVDDVRDAAAALVTAAEEASDVDASSQGQEIAVLRTALDLYDSHGEDDCPVCGQGRMDGSWAEQAREIVKSTENADTLRSQVGRKLQSARTAARTLISPLPAELAGAEDLDLTTLPELVETWQIWSSPPTGDRDLAQHLVDASEMLRSAATSVQDEARQRIAVLDGVWAPVAVRIAAWVGDARIVQTSNSALMLVEQAHTWLKNNDQSLKNERILAVADQARKIWSDLRQESNVDLAELKLKGTKTKRTVEITARVDGEDAGALSVMSQGELHALALALFLPRATMPASPFRFLVIDDPVQAMDPAKVDGLVKVLVGIARDRQVIVFSHDDRLADATRRGAPGALILEVVRSTGSDVSVRQVSNPADRYLDDAKAICRDARLPDETLRLTLPGLLRLAAESAARTVFFSRRCGRGESIDDVSTTWNGVRGTSGRVSLAVHDSVAPLDSWLDAHSYRKRSLGICTSAAHQGLHGHPDNAVEDVKRLVSDIRQRQ